MERAILFTDLANLKKYNNIDLRYKRLYFGNEYCQKLIPTETEFGRVLDFCHRKNLALSLLTPLVTSFGLRKLDKLFCLLIRNSDSFEVVINDWGVLDLVNEKYKQLIPVLGRLMFAQKRDPRLVNIINDKQEAKITVDHSGNKTIFLPKGIPAALKTAYSNTNIGLPEMANFLVSRRVRRVEFDNLLHGLSFNLPPGISGSVYTPFGCIAVTRICPMLTEIQKRERISKCKQECRKYFWKLRAASISKIIYKKGAALFYKNPDLSVNKWMGMGIDRLIYQPDLPI